MFVSEITTKIIVFKHEKGLSQGEIARELGVTEQHLCNVLNGRYPVSKKFEFAVRDMFKRYGYTQALTDKGEL